MLRTGDRLDEFEILEALGEGGMGQVYLARDTTLKRQVAVKVISESLGRDSAALARFQREAELLATVEHPNIAAIYRVATAKHEGHEVRYLVLERVEGETLAARLRHGPLPIDEAVGVASQIARALQAAHRQGVIHRDLKPANVMLTPRGQVKVLDFGIAKALTSSMPQGNNDETPTQADVTATGTLIGTAPYMSPEQIRGAKVDARADVWAFGCVLHEMLTGARAFVGETGADVMSAILEHDPDFSRLPADTPETVRSLLRRCLQKQPRRRLRDIGDARLELEDTQGTTDPLRSTKPVRALARPCRTVAAATGIIVIASIAIATGIGPLRDWISGDALPVALAAVTSTVVLPATVEGPEDAFIVGLHRLYTEYLVNSGELAVKLPPTQEQIDELGGEYARLARAYEGVDAFVIPAVTVGPASTRFSLSLVQPRTRVVLWTDQATGTPEYYPDMARQMMERLMQSLRPGAASPGQENAAPVAVGEAAIQLRAGQDWSRRYNVTHSDPFYEKARSALDRALALDPALAPAAGERGLLELFRLEHIKDPALIDAVSAWAQKARELDSRNGLGWVLMNPVALHRGNPLDSLAPALKGAALGPRSAIAHHGLGVSISSQFSLRLGFAAYERAANLDPTYLYPRLNASNNLLNLDRAVEALQGIDRLLAIEPGFAAAQQYRFLTLTDLGRLDEAAAQLERLRALADEGAVNADQMEFFADTLRLAKALEQGSADLRPAYAAVRLVYERSFAVDLGVNITILARHGHLDESLALMEVYAQIAPAAYDYLQLNRALEPLRTDPRFVRIVAASKAHFAASREIIEEVRAAGEFPEYLEEPYRRLIEQLEPLDGPGAVGASIVAELR